MLNLEHEKKLFNQGYRLIAGIDEAGRGPLAGPVVAACVVSRPSCKVNLSADKAGNEKLKEVRDSKKLTPKKRQELFDIICEEFDEVGIGICDHQTIDRINILEASFLAMKKAISALKTKPDFLILDGQFKIPNCSYKQEAIIRGDELVFSIAAASIVAKVTRDRIMKEAHEKYPEYGFDRHKGYGTKLHREMIDKHGPCPIHRLSFRPIKKKINKIKNRNL